MMMMMMMQTGQLERVMSGQDCCLSTNVHLVCDDSVLTALVSTTHLQLQHLHVNNAVTPAYRLQVRLLLSPTAS